MKERLIEFLAYLQIGQTRFEEKVGLSRGLINNLKGDVSLKSLKKITDAYPELNESWLCTGEGEMLKISIVNNRGNVNTGTVGGDNVNISGSHNTNFGNHHETKNYNGLNVEDLIKMMEERFQHMLQKEEDIRAIFEENRKLTDEVIRQNADFRIYNEAYRKLQERINSLTDKSIEK